MTFEEFYKERFLDYYLEFAYEADQRFIKKYLREFTKEFKMRGYDDETIRRIILGDLIVNKLILLLMWMRLNGRRRKKDVFGTGNL